MNKYQINYYKNVPNVGWVMESVRATNSVKKRMVAQLTKTPNIRCVEVVRLK